MPHMKKAEQGWVQEMLAEHEELRGTLASLRAFLEDPRPDPGERGFHHWATGMSEKLLGLHDALFRHFRNEEESGVFRDLEIRYPRASRRIAVFQEQHTTLLGALRRLMVEVVEYSAGIASDDPRLRKKVAEVLGQVESHEQRETELMQRMLYNDLGEGD